MNIHSGFPGSWGQELGFSYSRIEYAVFRVTGLCAHDNGYSGYWGNCKRIDIVRAAAVTYTDQQVSPALPLLQFNSAQLIMIVFLSLSCFHVGFRAIFGISIRSPARTVETAPSVYPDSPNPSTSCSSGCGVSPPSPPTPNHSRNGSHRPLTSSSGLRGLARSR